MRKPPSCGWPLSFSADPPDSLISHAGNLIQGGILNARHWRMKSRLRWSPHTWGTISLCLSKCALKFQGWPGTEYFHTEYHAAENRLFYFPDFCAANKCVDQAWWWCGRDILCCRLPQQRLTVMVVSQHLTLFDKQIKPPHLHPKIGPEPAVVHFKLLYFPFLRLRSHCRS